MNRIICLSGLLLSSVVALPCEYDPWGKWKPCLEHPPRSGKFQQGRMRNIKTGTGTEAQCPDVEERQDCRPAKEQPVEQFRKRDAQGNPAQCFNTIGGYKGPMANPCTGQSFPVLFSETVAQAPVAIHCKPCAIYTACGKDLKPDCNGAAATICCKAPEDWTWLLWFLLLIPILLLALLIWKFRNRLTDCDACTVTTSDDDFINARTPRFPQPVSYRPIIVATPPPMPVTQAVVKDDARQPLRLNAIPLSSTAPVSGSPRFNQGEWTPDSE